MFLELVDLLDEVVLLLLGELPALLAHKLPTLPPLLPLLFLQELLLLFGVLPVLFLVLLLPPLILGPLLLHPLHALLPFLLLLVQFLLLFLLLGLFSLRPVLLQQLQLARRQICGRCPVEGVRRGHLSRGCGNWHSFFARGGPRGRLRWGSNWLLLLLFTLRRLSLVDFGRLFLDILLNFSQRNHLGDVMGGFWQWWGLIPVCGLLTGAVPLFFVDYVGPLDILPEGTLVVVPGSRVL